MKLYPIAFNFPPLSSGRHCDCADIDKVDSLDRFLDYEDRYRAAKIGQWSRRGLQAIRLVGNCFRGRSNKRLAPITEEILRLHRTTIHEQLPALELMEEAGLIQLSVDIEGRYTIMRKLEALTGPMATPLVTKIVTEDMHATNIPDGTILAANTMIVFGNHENRIFGEHAHFANSKPGESDLFLTLDFVIQEGEHTGKYVSKDVLLGSKEVWPTITAKYPPEYFQIANSAYNIFSDDQSDEANNLRQAINVCEAPPYWCLQDKLVVIEIGLSKDGSGKNHLKSIVQPEHTGYLEAADLGEGIQPGTGVFGDYTPPLRLVNA